jgi:uncharacterized 2Fe-2S/4Fe-4S cluster protein (DUF4445 family)
MAKIIIITSDEQYEAEVPVGSRILDAADQVGFVIETPCNGSGTCGKCKVQIIEDQSKETSWVLACQKQVTCDTIVQIPQRSASDPIQILQSGLERATELDSYIYKQYNTFRDSTDIFGADQYLGFESGNTTDFNYGIVVDIGTTTLVTSLVNLNTGKEVAVTSALNPQSQYGQDVLSRIRFASQPEGLAKLHQCVIDAINTMIRSLTCKAKIIPEQIYEVIFSGNTCMLHLAVNSSPLSLGKYPYVSQLKGNVHLAAASVGLIVSSLAKVYLPPIISAYIGADITSGIIAAGLEKSDKIVLFIDIGTNGEMILAGPMGLIGTSTAAGPAFEGMNIACGMRASAGAIESFQITEAGIRQQTIGDFPPIGICGSGLIDIVSELVTNELVSPSGKFIQYKNVPENSHFIVLREGKAVFDLGHDLYLSQQDVRQVQLAKGAIRSGIEALLKQQGVSYDDVSEVQIAGSFGYHLKTDSLISIGLLPQEFRGKVTFLGNTAKTGGHVLLINQAARLRAAEWTQKVQVIDLSHFTDFDKLFVKCLSF